MFPRGRLRRPSPGGLLPGLTPGAACPVHALRHAAGDPPTPRARTRTRLRRDWPPALCLLAPSRTGLPEPERRQSGPPSRLLSPLQRGLSRRRGSACRRRRVSVAQAVPRGLLGHQDRGVSGSPSQRCLDAPVSQPLRPRWVRVCLHPTAPTLGKPFVLTTPGGQPVSLLGDPAEIPRGCCTPFRYGGRIIHLFV